MTPFLQNVERWHVVLLAAAVAAAALTTWVSPVSLFLGGAVMGLNLWAMARMAQRFVRPVEDQSPTRVLGFVVIKFALFLGLLGALFWRAPIDPIGFGIGVTVLLVACVAEALRQGALPA